MAVSSAVVKNTWRGIRKAPEMIPNCITTKLSVSGYLWDGSSNPITTTGGGREGGREGGEKRE